MSDQRDDNLGDSMRDDLGHINNAYQNAKNFTEKAKNLANKGQSNNSAFSPSGKLDNPASGANLGNLIGGSTSKGMEAASNLGKAAASATSDAAMGAATGGAALAVKGVKMGVDIVTDEKKRTKVLGLIFGILLIIILLAGTILMLPSMVFKAVLGNIKDAFEDFKEFFLPGEYVDTMEMTEDEIIAYLLDDVDKYINSSYNDLVNDIYQKCQQANEANPNVNYDSALSIQSFYKNGLYQAPEFIDIIAVASTKMDMAQANMTDFNNYLEKNLNKVSLYSLSYEPIKAEVGKTIPVYGYEIWATNDPDIKPSNIFTWSQLRTKINGADGSFRDIEKIYEYVCQNNYYIISDKWYNELRKRTRKEAYKTIDIDIKETIIRELNKNYYTIFSNGGNIEKITNYEDNKVLDTAYKNTFFVKSEEPVIWLSAKDFMGKDALEFYIQNFGETTIWIKDPDQGVSEEKRNSLQTQPGHEWKYDINGSHEYYSCVTKTVYMTDFKNMPMEIEALKDTYYYNVTVKYNEDAIFKIFEVDPDAEYTNFHDSDEDSEDEVATSDSNSKDIYTNRDYFNESKETISDLVEETKFIKSVMATSAIKAEEVRELLKLTQSNAPVSNNRYEFVKNALTLIGVVPYNSQGYPVTGGWNEENGWWNYTNMDSYGRPGGLCSAGFVQWALMTTGYNDYGIIISPYVLEQAVAFGNNTLQIVNNPDDIKPGDIAVETGNLQNIVSKDIGIYVGQKDGVQYYVYINAEKNTVVCDAHEGSFNKFYRLSSIDGSDWQDFSHDAIPEYQPNINNERTDDVFAIARTLQEYATEGLDARLGIGLVITNRYDNTNFPNDYVAVCKGLTQTNTSYIPSSTNIMMALRIYERDNNERYSALFDGIDTKNVLYYRCVKDQAASKRKDDYNGHTFVKLINHMAFYR